MKPIILPIVGVMLAETGANLVVFNASPHAPFGFWLWFGGIAALAPIAGYGLYRRLTVKA